MTDNPKEIITIFENYASSLNGPLISSNGRKRNFNLTRDIQDRRIEIKKLLKTKIAGEKLYTTSERKPTPLLKFEEGFRKIFFAYNGPIYDKCEIFRKGLNYLYQKKKKNLNERIQAGALTYYFLKEQDDQPKIDKLKNNTKEKLLNFSHNYNIADNKDINVEHFKKGLENVEIKVNDNFFNILYQGKLSNKENKKRKKKENEHQQEEEKEQEQEQEQENLNEEEKDENNIKLEHNYYLSPLPKHYKSYIKVNDNNNTNSTQKETIYVESSTSTRNKKTKPKLQIPLLKIKEKENINTNFNNDYYKTSDDIKNNLTITARSSLNYSLSNRINLHNYSNSFSDKDKLFILEEKRKARTIQKKMDLIKRKQTKLGNRLYKIIDRQKYLKPLSVEFKRDAEAIMGSKMIKKKHKGKTKEDVVHAKRIENSYAHMGKKKREMIEISDNLAKMDDIIVRQFSDDIKKNYWKKTGKKKFEEPEIVKKKRLEEEKKFRIKFNNRNFQMEKLRFNLFYTLSQVRENINHGNSE